MEPPVTNQDLYRLLEDELVSKKSEKQRHQVKSRWYYIFWGTCTVAVCAGQIIVGSGFRRMAESLDKVLDAPIRMDIGIPRDHWHSDQKDGLYHPTDPPITIR